jgi:hypothetical protein
MRRTAIAVTLLALSSGCAPPQTKPPAPPPAPTVAEPAPLATVSLDALPVGLQGIVIDGHGPNLARMTLSTAELSCELPPRHDDEQRLTLTMVRELGAKDQWRVARLGAATPQLQGETIFALRDAPIVRVPPVLEKNATASAHFNLPLVLDKQTVRFEVSGDLPGMGCGSLASTGGPVAHESLSMSVAGEAIPIAGAVYRRDPATRRHRLILSSSAMGCDESPRETEVAVDLTLDRIGRSVEAIGLGGMRVGEDLDASVSAGAIRTKLQGLGKAVRITLDGSTEVHGYPLAFSGATEVTYCR